MGHFLPFTVSLWHKGGFHAQKGSIIGFGVSLLYGMRELIGFSKTSDLIWYFEWPTLLTLTSNIYNAAVLGNIQLEHWNKYHSYPTQYQRPRARFLLLVFRILT